MQKQKTILITGATDGIGLATAKMLVSKGHHVLIHGRSNEKLANVEKQLIALNNDVMVKSYRADLSKMSEVTVLAEQIIAEHKHLDALINNAGVYKVPNSITPEGLDVRFVVNTISPYFLTQKLLPLLGDAGRVINLSSAAQAPVNVQALLGKASLSDMEAYAQSKLAITMWTKYLAETINNGPVLIAVNPGSLLASKMVKEGFGVAGSDINIGATILSDLAIEDEFASRSGQYFDNDSGRFTAPHPAGTNKQSSQRLVEAIESVLTR